MKIFLFFAEMFAVSLLLYLIFLPAYPALKYRYLVKDKFGDDPQSLEIAKETAAQSYSAFPESEYSVSSNRLIINKIGVNAPIVESASAESGLAKGAWRVPQGSTPDKGGNTVITGHRFKYLPPNNLTFYLFDKLELGDIAVVIWEKNEYYYRIKEIKIVPATELSIQAPSKEPIITMFTCHPIYSTANRLVVVAELIEKKYDK